MATDLDPRTPDILARYRRIVAWPGGRSVFDYLIGSTVPYAGSIRPQVEVLEPGRARVAIADRRAVRNHLGSVHAAALVNLGELAANLALMTRQPRDGRWIVRGLDVDFVKVARGPVRAEANVPELAWTESRDVPGEAVVTDSSGATVAVVRPRWRIGPKKPAQVAA